MSNKYRVISISYLDVYASDDSRAIEIANNEYHAMDKSSQDSIRSIITAYDVGNGLSKDQLLSLGMDLDVSENKFVPVNEPF